MRGKWVIQDIDRKRAIYSVGDYWNDMLERTLKGRPIYLVKGTPVAFEDSRGEPYRATGADGEPLLEPESMHKVKTLNPHEVFIVSTEAKSVGERWDAK